MNEFSQLPDDALVYLFESLGLNQAILNNMRLVDKRFNQTVSRLVEDYLRRINIQINARSNKILHNKDEIEFSKEKETLDILDFVEFLKKIGGTEAEKTIRYNLIKEVEKSYLQYVRTLIIGISEKNEDYKILFNGVELSKKEALYQIVLNAYSSGHFHLLWEQNDDSKFNQCLKSIVQTHFDDVAISKLRPTLKDFRNADLSGVKIGDKPTGQLVNLDGFLFDNANLKNVDFSGAYDINTIELVKARSHLGIRGILGDHKTETYGPVAGNVKVEAPAWKGNVPRIQANIELQKKNMEEYMKVISETNDFMEVLSMLNELARSNNTNGIYAKTFVSDFMPTKFNSYKEVMLLGREKLVLLANRDEIKLNDLTAHQIHVVKKDLEQVFIEPFGADCLNFFGGTKNQEQLEIILKKSNLDDIQQRKLEEMNLRIAQQNKNEGPG